MREQSKKLHIAASNCIWQLARHYRCYARFIIALHITVYKNPKNCSTYYPFNQIPKFQSATFKLQNQHGLNIHHKLNSSLKI